MEKLINYIRKYIFFDLLFVIYSIGIYMYYFNDSPLPISFYILVSIFFIELLIKAERKYIVLYVAAAISLLGTFFISPLNGGLKIYNLVMLGHCGMAISFLRNRFSMFILIMVFLFFAFKFIATFINEGNILFIFEIRSYNYVSVIILFYLAIFIFSSHTTQKFTSLIIPFALIASFICLIAIGRSGIISSLLILIGVFQLRVKSKITKSIVFFSIAIAGILVIPKLISTNEYLIKFANEGFETARSDINYQYVSTLDFGSFFMGNNIENVDQTTHFDNLHNSFLDLHNSVGIFSFYFLFLFILAFLFKFFDRTESGLLLIYLALLLRASTDTILLVNSISFGSIVLTFTVNFLVTSEKTRKYIKQIIH